MKNWAGNYTFAAERIVEPTGVEQIQHEVANTSQIKALGSRHCFNDIADSSGTQLSMSKLNRVRSIDPTNQTVTVEGGITYGQLAPVLQDHGLALPNLASLPHISIAGAVATGTHGSGAGNGCLSTAVRSLQLVKAGGALVTLSRGDADFDGAVVSLGALGIVTALTLDCVQSFDIEQRVVIDLPMKAFVEQMDQIVGSVYSLSCFTDWQSDRINQVWLKGRRLRSSSAHGGEGGMALTFQMRSDHPVDLVALGAKAASRQLHPIEGPLDSMLTGIDPSKCTEQLGIPGPWHERLPHFKLEFTPSSGEELQSEYFVDRKDAAAAYAAVATLRDQIRPLIQISELRFIASDDLWLSPCFGRATAAIHFTWRRDPRGVEALLHKLEKKLAPFNARPHWGKVFVTSRERLAELYPKMDELRRLRASFDPGGKLTNTYLSRVL